MALRIIGGLLIAFGVVDVVGSFLGLDVWNDWFGVDLPAAIWSFTAYIEMGIGYLLYSLGSRTSKVEDTEPRSADTQPDE